MAIATSVEAIKDIAITEDHTEATIISHLHASSVSARASRSYGQPLRGMMRRRCRSCSHLVEIRMGSTLPRLNFKVSMYNAAVIAVHVFELPLGGSSSYLKFPSYPSPPRPSPHHGVPDWSAFGPICVTANVRWAVWIAVWGHLRKLSASMWEHMKQLYALI